MDLQARFGETLFSKNRGSLVAGIALAAAAAGLMHLLDAPGVFFFAIGGAMVLLLLFFAKLLPAYSVGGRKLQDGIEKQSDHTLEEVGTQFDVTRERIRQIEAKANRKQKHPSRSDKLRTY